ncbi:MAG: ROK family protein [Lachnospiraceae bacterium]|nr:ROK family protein [Lachnospiraceae bacterium]
MKNYKKYYIGVDVGGTTIKYGLFEKGKKDEKKLLAKFYVDTVVSRTNPEKAIIKGIISDIERFCENNEYGVNKSNLAGIGLAIPGPVVDNNILRAVNINWKKHYDAYSAIKKEFGNKVKVTILNDGNAAALGEYYYSLKGKYDSICLMTLGTAIGIGIIIDNKLIEGKTGIAGELSHMKVDFSKKALKCNCGNTGCLETVTGGRGIANVYNSLYHTNVMKGAKDVISRAKVGDKKALAALEKSLDYLSMAISIIMLVYEPEVILIGGGVSNEGTFVTNIIKEHLKDKVYMTKKLPKILLAKLKNDAGIYGAVSKL